MNIVLAKGNIEAVLLLLSQSICYNRSVTEVLINNIEISDKSIPMMVNTKNGPKETKAKVDI